MTQSAIAKDRRAFNFSAGPSMLPDAVIRRMQEELLDWHGCGMSIMEVSHRGRQFEEIVCTSKERLSRLLNIPADYAILFLPGGATVQFAAVPMNLRHRGLQADYVCTGHWGERAIAEARRFIDVRIAAADFGPMRVPRQEELAFNPRAGYVHYTPNETIAGLEFPYIPDTAGVPLVGDFSSTLLSRPLDVSRFGVLYACAQKNIGIAGITILIVQRDLIAVTAPHVPRIFDWQTQVASDSCHNTPPTFSWYVVDLVLQWLEEQGGLPAMATHNRAKAQRLYDFIDRSAFYSNAVERGSRSWMNVPFSLADGALNQVFLAESEEAGLTNLKGHKSVGGMRASIYNAMPLAGIEALIEFMTDFESKHG